MILWSICAGALLTEEDVEGLRSLYRPRKVETLSISCIEPEQWEVVKVTAWLQLRVWIGAINPVSEHKPKAFCWDDSPESSQSKRSGASLGLLVQYLLSYCSTTTVTLARVVLFIAMQVSAFLTARTQCSAGSREAQRD